MSRNPTQRSLSQTDFAISTEFLTTAAGRFFENGLCSQSTTDDLRFSLQEIFQQNDVHLEHSLLVFLSRKSDPLVDLLIHRYGPTNLSLNLSRFAYRQSIQDLVHILAYFGAQLNTRSEQMLNFRIYTYVGGKKERINLISTWITEFSSQVKQAIETLNNALAIIQNMLPSERVPYSNFDTKIDEAIASSQGFTSVSKETIPFLLERQLNRCISQAISILTDYFSELYQQLEQNDLDLIEPKVNATTDWLIAESQRILFIGAPATVDLESCELRRQNYMSVLKRINQEVKFFTIEVLRRLTAGNLKDLDYSSLPAANLRMLSGHLLEAGNHPEDVKKAILNVSNYCNLHDISPADMLVEEFNHLHPLLSEQCKSVLCSTLPEKNQTYQPLGERTRTVQAIENMKNFFIQHLNAIVALPLMMTLAFSQISCGVKASPRSSISDIRPQLPFKSQVKKKPPLPRAKKSTR